MHTECYMCSALATTDEHVPPRCFFPKQKDLQAGANLRVNLITVPSCKLHNTTKSKDDEYILNVIVACYGNNPIALNHFSHHIIRTIKRRPALFMMTIRERFPVFLGSRETITFRLDRPRLDRTLDNLTRALYYSNFKNKLLMPIHFHCPQLHSIDKSNSDIINRLTQQITTAVEHNLSEQPFLGDNPDVFKYQFGRQDNIEIIRMIFYGGFNVIAISGSDLET